MLELLRRLVVLILTVATGSPEATAYEEAYRRNLPELVEPLIRICRRESVGLGAGRCHALSAHPNDASQSLRVHTRAVKAGWLRGWCQPHSQGQWSTRGPYGLMAAYHVRWLFPCAPYWLLDVPVFSTKAASRKLLSVCQKPRWKRHKAARAWEGSDCEWWRQHCRRALKEKRSTQGCRWVWEESKG